MLVDRTKCSKHVKSGNPPKNVIMSRTDQPVLEQNFILDNFGVTDWEVWIKSTFKMFSRRTQSQMCIQQNLAGGNIEDLVYSIQLAVTGQVACA